MRKHLKAAASRALAWTGGDRLIAAATGQRRAPLIVGYHRVVKDFAAMRRTSLPAMLITSRTFEQQIDWIARRYRITTLDEIGALLESGAPFEERLAAITFDDGYADVYHNAFPILRRKGLPGALFVVTDLIGRRELQTFDRLFLLLSLAMEHPSGVGWLSDHESRSLRMLPLDPVRATRILLKELPQEALSSVLSALERRFPMPEGGLDVHRSLDREMLVEMNAAGMTIGSHTRTHSLLSLEEAPRIRDEVEGSRRMLRQLLGREIDHFAYPDGSFNSGVLAAVKAAGYRFAYGVCGHRNPEEPLLTIPRRTLWENSCLDGQGRFSSSVMSCNINGVFDFAARCRRDHRTAATAPQLVMA